jgi:signal peptidase II
MSDELQPNPPPDESAPPAEGASPVEGAAGPAAGSAPLVDVAAAPKAEAPAAPVMETGSKIDEPAPPAAIKQVELPREPLPKPNYVFLGVVSITSLVADLASKWWAKTHLEDAKSFADRHVELIPNYLSLSFAKNKGGAWGLLQNEPESIRRPFFLGISALAVVFIVSLYRRLTPQQTALKWGLPLVLGGALGNLVNRIQYNYVVDFIDAYYKTGHQEHHWPTFNIADVAIVVGVGLMAVDMFTSRRTPKANIPAESAFALARSTEAAAPEATASAAPEKAPEGELAAAPAAPEKAPEGELAAAPDKAPEPEPAAGA